MGNVDDFSGRASRYWQERGGRMTVVREVICHSISEQDSAFTADELWQEARKRDRGISMASVYRTLTHLVESELLREIHHIGDHRSFVKADSPADSRGQVICSDCHRIVALENNAQARDQEARLREMGFETEGMRLTIQASCEILKRCGACENKKTPEDFW
jgi:Fur family transcriptional regulator, ferric uptake regulator